MRKFIIFHFEFYRWANQERERTSQLTCRWCGGWSRNPNWGHQVHTPCCQVLGHLETRVNKRAASWRRTPGSMPLPRPSMIFWSLPRPLKSRGRWFTETQERHFCLHVGNCPLSNPVCLDYKTQVVLKSMTPYSKPGYAYFRWFQLFML